MRNYLYPGLGAIGATVALLLLSPVGGLAWSGAQHAVGASERTAKAAPKRGPRGPRGRRGPRGFRGARGAQGLQGPVGSAGLQGIQGLKGAKGDTGVRGVKGGLDLYCARSKAKPFAFPDAPCRAQSYAVDTLDSVGSPPSIEIGVDGNPVISYANESAGDLRLARCNDPLCSGGDETLSTVDSVGSVGSSGSLAIGPDGSPVISYWSVGPLQVKVVHCNDPACAGDDETPHVVAGSSGSPLYNGFTSIAIATDGNPTVAYEHDGHLELVHCNDPACAGGDETARTVDPTGLNGISPSLALGIDGNPVISYYYDDGGSNGDLKVAHCNDPACAPGGDTLTTVDSAGNVGSSSSLAIGTDGNPVISYHDVTHQTLKVARCNDPACAGNNETLSTLDNSGFYDSIAVGPDGNPIIAYFSTTDHLNVARCNDPACAGHNEALSTVDPAPQVGQLPTIAIGLDGNPVIAHLDVANGDLKVSRPAVP